MTASSLPRGLRNNNPFNIRRSDQPWIGRTSFPSSVLGISCDPDFEQFRTMVYGVRAGMKLLYNYIYLFGLTTVYDILDRFAPRRENALDAYVHYVENYLKLSSAGRSFSFGSSLVGKRDLFFTLCEAIIRYENGIGYNCLKNFKLDSQSLSATFDSFFPKYSFKNF